MNKSVEASDAFRPTAALSQGYRAGDLLFTAGFGPQDPASGEIVGDSVGEQTDQALKNVEAVLRAAGATFVDVVKVTVHLADLQRDFKEFDRVYTARFRSPYPARTTVGSNLLGFLVEIDVVAVVPQG